MAQNVPNLTLTVLPERYAICRLDAAAPLPAWATADGFVSITRTDDELSIIVKERHAPSHIQAERGFIGLKVVGPLAFDVVGVLSALAAPLAAAGIPIVALGTYDTDYLFIHASHYTNAAAALTAAGHTLPPHLHPPT